MTKSTRVDTTLLAGDSPADESTTPHWEWFYFGVRRALSWPQRAATMAQR